MLTTCIVVLCTHCVHYLFTFEPLRHQKPRTDHRQNCHEWLSRRHLSLSQPITGFCPQMCEAAHESDSVTFLCLENLTTLRHFDAQCVKRRLFAQESAFWGSRKQTFLTSSCCTCWLFIFIVKLFNCFVSFATGYIHSGEIKIYINSYIWTPFFSKNVDFVNNIFDRF